MRVWKKALIINVGIVAGCFFALYLVPLETPMWLFGLTCSGAAVALNLAIFLGPRIRKRSGSPAKTDSFRSITVWVMLAVALFLLLLMRLGHMH